MTKKHLFMALVLAMLVNALGGNLLKNPQFKDDLGGWSNWGKDRLAVSVSAEGAFLKSEKPGLNQGLAQTLELKPSCKYEYSARFKANFGENAYASVLSWYCPKTKKRGQARQISGDVEWDTHKMIFNTPHDLQEKVLLRPLVIFGPAEVTIAEVTLRELGVAAKVEPAAAKPELPVIVPVVHPKIKMDLSKEHPANARAHINEKNALLPDGASVLQENSSFIINYAFTTPGHDAVMFDIVKEIPSCAKVSMEVSSNGKGHRLFFVLVDQNDESHYVTKPLVLDFEQRKLVMSLTVDKEAPYSIYDSKWGGDGNQRLDLPLKRITIGVDDRPDSTIENGTVIIKNLQIGNW